MKHFFTLLTMLALTIGAIAQDDITDKVVLTLKNGNSKELSQYFIPNIDLTVLGTDDVYSKAQAEQILRKFFGENKPSGFTIEHNGVSKMGDHYVIGNLATSNGDHRVTFFQKQVDGAYLVKQLRIEQSKQDR